MGTNLANQIMMSYVCREFSSVRGKMIKRFRSVKRSSLGMPLCTPKKYSRRLKRLSLGIPPCIPFSINNYQFVFRSTIFLSLHVLCAMLGASCFQFPFQFSLALLAFHNELELSFLCVGEKHAPLQPRTQHRIFMFIFVVYVLGLSIATIMFSSQFSCLSF